GWIDYEKLFLVTAALALVKTGFGFVAKQACLNHAGEEVWRFENFAFRIVRKRFVEVLDHVREHIQANQIESTKSRALGPAGCRSGDLVYFFDGVAVVQHRLERHHRAVCSDTIGDEVRTILCRHYAFAQTLIQKPKGEARNFRLGPLSANYLDQVQVTR